MIVIPENDNVLRAIDEVGSFIRAIDDFKVVKETGRAVMSHVKYEMAEYIDRKAATSQIGGGKGAYWHLYDGGKVGVAASRLFRFNSFTNQSGSMAKVDYLDAITGEPSMGVLGGSMSDVYRRGESNIPFRDKARILEEGLSYTQAKGNLYAYFDTGYNKVKLAKSTGEIVQTSTWDTHNTLKNDIAEYMATQMQGDVEKAASLIKNRAIYVSAMEMNRKLTYLKNDVLNKRGRNPLTGEFYSPSKTKAYVARLEKRLEEITRGI